MWNSLWTACRNHDDDAFALLFPPERRRLLPMSALHAGPTEVNWNTAKLARFWPPRSAASGDQTLWPIWKQLLSKQISDRANVAVVGCFSNGADGPLGCAGRRNSTFATSI